MKYSKAEYLQNWLIKANEDLDVILMLSSVSPENFTSAISFHAQQAVEKYLKAFLVFSDFDFNRTHDVDFLLSECISLDKQKFEDVDLKNLNDFAVTVRYPDDFITPTLIEALEYKELAFQIKNIVEEKIKF